MKAHYYKNEVQFTSPKSLWDLKSEINSLHFIDFTIIKVISL
jgi:hypothetical protein